MTRAEMADLIEFISVACPQQKINRATAIAWYDIIGDLEFSAARNAVIAVKHSQAFVDTSDIIREAQRAQTRTVGDDPARHPSARSAAEAITASSLRELDAAPAVPPTAEYLAAKGEMDRKQQERDEAAAITDYVASRRAEDWIAYKLRGQLPMPPLAAPAAPRWVPLPGDPPELQAWLSHQPAEAER